MKKFISKFIMAALIVLVAPFMSIAAEPESIQGTIIVKVTDQGGTDFSGSWLLKRGVNSLGHSIRNGSSGETFQKDNGFYFLEAYRTDKMQAVEIIGENPATLEVGGRVNFLIRYYEDEEAKELAALASPLTGAEATQPIDEPEEPEATDPADEPEATAEPDPTADETNSSTGPLVPDTTEPTGPAPGSIDPGFVPEFGTAPATAGDAGDSQVDLSQVIHLAETGSGMLALLIPSILGGLYAVRRRK